MGYLNRVFLMGNLTRDPELRYLPNNTPVASFGLAVNRKWKGANGEDREDTTFVDISAFARTAEMINQYFTKGKPIFIEGRLKFDQWEDKQGGGKRSKLSVVAENFQFVGDRGGSSSGGGHAPDADVEGGGRPAQRGPAQRYAAPRSSPPPQPSGDAPPPEQQVNDDDIPF